MVPFHSHVAIETLKESNSFAVSSRTENLCEINNVRQGGVVEINFTVPQNQPVADLEILFTHDGVKLPGFGTSLSNLRPGSNVRIVYKFPIIMNRVTFDMVSKETPMVLENLQVYHHQDMAVNITRDIWDGKRHQGGVTFDVVTNIIR